MEREELKGKVENAAVDEGGSREKVCACCCPPLARVKDDCPVEPKEGGR